ncbi:hypothetical protein [Thiocystis violascens]|uniref:Uncharacterized protein n=1 Tax=Thiocystis violascens (strain ATCC 17096 / DSM 198 / 6111) TaxID=765911 RepID=I3Y749_THIV6|nr:hypothetical protein [Thiocystis violascens]AFL72817.1 hypothetical protein Thivi_0766 [Thiocystis violascens DSM 198]
MNGWHLKLLATGLLLLHLADSQALQNPAVLLFGATLTDARAFAVEHASRRGWSIREVTANAALFEQVLDGEETDAILVVQRLLRIRAEFAEESDGVRVSLRAEEVEWPETDREWMADVTGRYADNLANALSSLRAKWDAWRGNSASLPNAPSSRFHGGVPPDSSRMAAEPIGTWAYAAERYAQSRGCELTERATQLESNGQDWERHWVFCRDGSRISVRCRYGDCTTGP